MPRKYEMSTLVERCKQRCDLENDESISDSEWKALVSEAYGADVYTVVCDAARQYFEHVSTIATDGQESYDEPEDHFSTIAIEYVKSDGKRRRLRPLPPQMRARWAGSNGNEAIWYAHVDDQIVLYPTPPAGQTYELLYVPQPPDLTTYADDDIVDVVTPDGEAALIWAVTVKAKSKSESDVQLAMVERDAAKQKLLEWAVAKMLLEPYLREVDEMDPRDAPISDGDWRFNR